MPTEQKAFIYASESLQMDAEEAEAKELERRRNTSGRRSGRRS